MAIACRLYRAALRMYPADYRLRFSAEMRTAFEAAALDTRRDGAHAYAGFLAAEAMALPASALSEWTAKLTSDPAARARTLPDCRRMRPVGVTRAEWSAGLDHAG